MLIAQVAVLANSVADTVMTGHYGAAHLAAVGIGAGIYVTVWIGLMGVLQALSPIVARHFGAGEFAAIGVQVRQGWLLAAVLGAVGLALLSFPRVLLELAHVPADVAPLAEAYLRAIAWGLPATLFVRVFYAFTPAVGRSRPVMAINLVAFAIKLPISYALLHGLHGLPELGAAGCAVGSVVMFWSMLLMAAVLLMVDPFYSRFDIFSRAAGAWRPHWGEIRRILGLGLPISAAMLIEVTSFTFIALFLAQLGATVSAAHQVIANLAALLFMVPLSLGIGTQVLIGQALGRKDLHRAREVALAGMRLAFVIAASLAVVLLVLRGRLLGLYTSDPAVLAIALNLLPLLAAFHLFDALQGLAGQALRGYQQTAVPTLIYAGSLWGIGLGGGWWLAFAGVELPVFGIAWSPQGAWGMWAAAAASLVVAAGGLVSYLLRISKPERAAALELA